MLILPLAPDLRVGYKPIVTFIVFFLCIGIHFLHERSQTLIYEATENYCGRLSDPWIESTTEKLLEAGLDDCVGTLRLIHELDGREFFEDLLKESRRDDSLEESESNFTSEVQQLLVHYDRFAAAAPFSLNAAMIYYPDSPNPIRMLSSGFLHADWSHVIFNMIFFLAFATALEVLIGNALLYIGIMATISVVTGISYSVYTALFDYPYPTLGFSAVVMGMIGLSAYLMPRARIRSFVWLGFWAWIAFIPAWIFAIWYIGWDLFELLSNGNAGETNLLAHVVGGVTGYYLGRWWLSDRKWLIEVELQDEIEHMRASRGDWFGIGGFRVDSRAFKRIKAAERLSEHVRAFDDVLREVYKLNETHQHGDAILVLLDGIARHGESEDELRSVFETLLTWTPSRFTLCFARHYVNYLFDHDKAKEALNVCDKCFAFAPDFVLARPLDVMPLAKAAYKQERYALVHALLHDSDERYGNAVDTTDAQILEARMLAHHLDRPDAANEILQRLLKTDDGPRRPEIAAMAAAIAPLLER